MSNWRQQWVSEKIEIAERLYKEECKGSYPESVLIISAAINAIAAELWPGKGIDRKRFVELLVQYTSVGPAPTTISTPLLTQHLEEIHRNSEAKAIRDQYLNVCDSQVLLGEDIDKSEHDIVGICPSLELEVVRENCYANLFYREVRSSYVHEYEAGMKSDSLPMTSSRNAKVSYTNTINEPRRIFFHISWLRDVALSAAENADYIRVLPITVPTKWWIEG